MGCHSCWTQDHKLRRQKSKKEREAKGEVVRQKVNKPEVCICKSCGQPTNTRNEGDRWDAAFA